MVKALLAAQRVAHSEATKRGMLVAKERGRLRGKKPKLSPEKEQEMVAYFQDHPECFAREVAARFGVARSTLYRAMERARQS